jgi:hypothetical protein
MENVEQPENELQTLISNASKAKNPAMLHGVITLIYDRVNLRKCFVKKSDIDRLNKLVYANTQLETFFCAGIIYNIIFSFKLIEAESLDSDFLLKVVNILYPMFQELTGTILNSRLIVHIRTILNILNRRPENSEEDLKEIKEFLENPSIKHNQLFFNFADLNEIKDAQECFRVMSGNHKMDGVMKIISVFERCSGLEEQLDIFSKKLQPLLKQMLIDSSEKSNAILKMSAIMLDHLFYQTEFLVKLKKSSFDPKSNFVEDKGLFFEFVDGAISKDKIEKEIITDDYFKSDEIDIFPYKATE